MFVDVLFVEESIFNKLWLKIKHTMDTENDLALKIKKTEVLEVSESLDWSSAGILVNGESVHCTQFHKVLRGKFCFGAGMHRQSTSANVIKGIYMSSFIKPLCSE